MVHLSARPNVTIAVIPRERFSAAQRSLESIYANTHYPFKLVYIDGNSPDPLREYLKDQSQAHNFKLIHTAQYLSPNQARNLAIAAVDTEYIVFVDNDVLVRPGWLKAIVSRAEETNAWSVAPLTLEGEGFDAIHQIGGTIIFKELPGGRKWMVERRPHMHSPLNKLKAPLQAQPTGLVEFHCVLSRRDVFDKVGLLDEALISMAEETDFSLGILEAGGTIYTEPASVITYLRPTVLDESDLPFFRLRWCDRWCESSVQRMYEKHKLDRDAPALRHYREFVHTHQKIASGERTRPRLQPYPVSDDLTMGERVRYQSTKFIRRWVA
ncbi:glycosyltransferase family 2 protein [cf. Phormidesmis sp. LEGE 11477]|uniref:glycosyltransferase family 2 protein n=1 Tax=cf. Phormidesmis sp. LEGE 11477 TaxID=1828680 RepID=UPI0018820DD3|nr:glycosyltransferase [cf. Phormidesmis sp. LEGE 11477]MBE9061713.1 glycosyltransferase [cf. Phormidesmis sp. LEGE 11477]